MIQRCEEIHFFVQKSNIKQLKEEIREKLPEQAHNGNGVSTPTRSAASTPTSSGANVIGTNANTTGTLKARKNRPAPPPPQRPNAIAQNGTSVQSTENLEIRGPSELLFGVPSTLKTQWRHHPKDLVTGNVTYLANVRISLTLFLLC